MKKEEKMRRFISSVSQYILHKVPNGMKKEQNSNLLKHLLADTVAEKDDPPGDNTRVPSELHQPVPAIEKIYT